MPPLVVGLGSPHGDDQAGWCVIERLRVRGVREVDALIARSPAELCHLSSGARLLMVCDAADDGRIAGSTGEWSWPRQPLPSRRGGTHDLSLGDALSLGLQLGTIPPQVEVWLITGREYRPMSLPCAEVLASAAQLADQLFQRWYHA